MRRQPSAPSASSEGESIGITPRFILVNFLHPAWMATLILSTFILLSLLLAKIYPVFLSNIGKFLSGFPHPEEKCLFCGGTSALKFILQGDFPTAWQANPFVIVILVVAVTNLGLLILVQLLRTAVPQLKGVPRVATNPASLWAMVGRSMGVTFPRRISARRFARWE